MMRIKENYLNREYTLKYRITDICFVGILAGVFFVCTEFFYRQIVYYNGYYSSDTSYYVNKAIEGSGKRAITFIFNKLYYISESVFEIAIFLGITIVSIIVMNYLISTWMIRKENIDTTRAERQLIALVSLFTGPIYMIGIHEYYYTHSWSKFAWHSPTQQLMMVASLVTIFLFFLMFENYINRINVFMWLGLMVASFVSAWSKPSFMLAFIPTIIILFLIELFAKDGYSYIKKFKKLFFFGCSMIPSGIYILYLNNVMFGESSSSEVVVQVKSSALNSELPVIILFSIAFPLVVITFNLGKYKTMPFKIIVMTFMIALFEYFMFAEQGDRASHGNFSWGRMFGTYLLFLYSINIAWANFKDKEFLSGKNGVRTLYFIVLVILLALHVVSQLCYLYIIFRGGSYLI